MPTHLLTRLFLLMPLLSACLMPDNMVNSGDLADRLVANKYVRSAQIDYPGGHVHYVLRPAQSETLLVFIHGTPGEWTMFSPLLDSPLLADKTSMIALDRPGWGKSTTTATPGTLSLQQQSAILGPVLAQLKQRLGSDRLVLVGHSLGASLVPRIAMDSPDVVDAVVAIAGDLTERYSPTHWYNTVASWTLVQWLLPESANKANLEVLALVEDLTAMGPLWPQLRAPLLVLQGTEDNLVDPRHADFAEEVGTAGAVKVVRYGDAGHFLPLTHSEEISQLLAELVAGRLQGLSMPHSELPDGG